jgi:phytol kinase
MPDALREALARAWPSPATAAAVGPAALAWAALAFFVVGGLDRRRGWRTGDTRKLFHLLIFAGAALVQRLTGFSGACTYGAAVSLVIFFALARGEGHPWFEAIARESDAPHRTWYVLVPWFATALGGLATNLLTPGHALFGYLAVGLADAVGEPIGIRFGRHRYRLPLPGRVRSWRSLEGSAAVFVAALAAGAVALALLEGISRPATDAAWISTACRLALFALVCTLVEAAAPHGWDNLLIQVVTGATARALFPI